MNLLELASDLGLHPKRTASTNGGEFHSPCPSCGGKDRFVLWPNSGRYWCRQCGSRGDGIQFCRDFLGLSFQEACEKMELDSTSPRICRPEVQRTLASTSCEPAAQWQTRADEFVRCCHQELLASSEALDYVISRGLTLATVRQFQIGWNRRDLWDSRAAWGLSAEKNGVWIPSGMVIPSFQGRQKPQKVKIRTQRSVPKYVLVSASRKQYSVYGDTGLPIVLVEAELDAILLQQEAGDLCCSMALGGAANRPDREMHLLLLARPILWSLDNDQAGTAQFFWWHAHYPHLQPWRATVGKSPSEAYERGIRLSDWVKTGLARKGKDNTDEARLV